MLIVSPKADSKETAEKLNPFRQFKVAREPRSDMRRTALWECFWDIIASFIHHFHIDTLSGADYLSRNRLLTLFTPQNFAEPLSSISLGTTYYPGEIRNNGYVNVWGGGCMTIQLLSRFEIINKLDHD